MRNATEANNIINNGLDLNAGEEVVIWSENHGTNNRAWAIRQQRNPNINIITVDLTGATTDQEVISRFVARVKPGVTRVVTFSEVRETFLELLEISSVGRALDGKVAMSRIRSIPGAELNLAGVQTPQASNNPGS